MTYTVLGLPVDPEVLITYTVSAGRDDAGNDVDDDRTVTQMLST